MKKIEVRTEQLNPFTQAYKFELLTQLYIEAFRGEPWNEFYTCPVCAGIFPSWNGSHCRVCKEQRRDVPVILYWTKEKVLTDLYREMTQPGFISLMGSIPGKIEPWIPTKYVGGAWGYTVHVCAETEDDLDAPGIHRIISGDFFYLDEVFVHPDHQKSGIGRKLIEEIFRLQQHPRILLRTLANSQMHQLSSNLGATTVLEISRGRVILQINL